MDDRPGRIKRLYKAFDPVNPVLFTKNAFRSGLDFEGQKEIMSLAKNKARALKELSQNTDPWAEGAPDMTDFDQVLEHWGIYEKTWLPIIIRNLWIQMIVFAALGSWGLLSFLMSPVYDLTSLFNISLIFLGVLVAISRTWKIKILTEKRFVFFKDWFLGGVFSCVGKKTPIKAQEKEGEFHARQ